jgi:hypothetical protein
MLSISQNACIRVKCEANFTFHSFAKKNTHFFISKQKKNERERLQVAG